MALCRSSGEIGPVGSAFRISQSLQSTGAAARGLICAILSAALLIDQVASRDNHLAMVQNKHTPAHTNTSDSYVGKKRYVKIGWGSMGGDDGGMGLFQRTETRLLRAGSIWYTMSLLFSSNIR